MRFNPFLDPKMPCVRPTRHDSPHCLTDHLCHGRQCQRPLIEGASTGVPVTSITLVAVGFVSPWPRPSGLDNPALPAASASFPVRLFSLEPPPCPCPHTHSGLTLGSSGLTGTSEHLEHRADGGGPTPTATTPSPRATKKQLEQTFVVRPGQTSRPAREMGHDPVKLPYSQPLHKPQLDVTMQELDRYKRQVAVLKKALADVAKERDAAVESGRNATETISQLCDDAVSRERRKTKAIEEADAAKAALEQGRHEREQLIADQARLRARVPLRRPSRRLERGAPHLRKIEPTRALGLWCGRCRSLLALHWPPRRPSPSHASSTTYSHPLSSRAQVW